jgi:hypothetical protein
MFWGQSMRPPTVETLELGGMVHCEDLAAKGMSGGGV